MALCVLWSREKLGSWQLINSFPVHLMAAESKQMGRDADKITVQICQWIYFHQLGHRQPSSFVSFQLSAAESPGRWLNGDMSSIALTLTSSQLTWLVRVWICTEVWTLQPQCCCPLLEEFMYLFSTGTGICHLQQYLLCKWAGEFQRVSMRGYLLKLERAECSCRCA